MNRREAMAAMGAGLVGVLMWPFKLFAKPEPLVHSDCFVVIAVDGTNYVVITVYPFTKKTKQHIAEMAKRRQETFLNSKHGKWSVEIIETSETMFEGTPAYYSGEHCL